MPGLRPAGPRDALRHLFFRAGARAARTSRTRLAADPRGGPGTVCAHVRKVRRAVSPPPPPPCRPPGPTREGGPPQVRPPEPLAVVRRVRQAIRREGLDSMCGWEKAETAGHVAGSPEGAGADRAAEPLPGEALDAGRARGHDPRPAARVGGQHRAFEVRAEDRPGGAVAGEGGVCVWCAGDATEFSENSAPSSIPSNK